MKKYDSLDDLNADQMAAYKELRDFLHPIPDLLAEHKKVEAKLEYYKKNGSFTDYVNLTKKGRLADKFLNSDVRELLYLHEALKLRIQHIPKLRSYLLKKCRDVKVPHKFIAPLLGISEKKMGQYLYYNTEWYRIIKKNLGKSYGKNKR